MRPTVQASATRPHRVIPRCSHYSIRTARSPRPQAHLYRDHPAGPLERLRLEAPTRLARLCGIQWPLARLADDADSCAPFLRHCGEHPASRTHERARDRSRHGSSNRSPHDRGATAGTRYVRPRGVMRYGAQRWSRRHLLNDSSGSRSAPTHCVRPCSSNSAGQLLVSARRHVSGSARAFQCTPQLLLRRRFR